MSFRSFILAGAVALASFGGAGRALAESRIALVIGNSAYQSVPQLPNPTNDARHMAEFLKSARFEVITARDLTQNEMRRTIGEFARKVANRGPDTIALVYYGGHGLQVDGDNYLVPVDANIKQEADVPLQTLRLADLMNALAAVPSKTRIVMLDACRNNPFSELNKTGGRGLAIVDAPNGSIVSYATAPGSEAEDGEGRNSPYTSAFLTVAREAGMPIEQAFKRVRYAVHQSTDGRQTPWESSSLTGDFSFFPGKTETTGVAPAETGQQLASLGSAFGKPIIEMPHVGKPIIDKPVLGKPILDKPIIAKPILDKPTIERPHVGKPIIAKPILDRPTLEKPHVVKPILEKPRVVKPFLDRRAAISKPQIMDKPRFASRTPIMAKPQIMGRPTFNRPQAMGAPMRSMSMRPMMGGGMGGGMRFGGGGGFGRR